MKHKGVKTMTENWEDWSLLKLKAFRAIQTNEKVRKIITDAINKKEVKALSRGFKRHV